jgi:hypothetical protein
MARFFGTPLARSARIEVYRKVDLELLVFAYFLGSQILLESLWPGPSRDADGELVPPPKAPQTPTAVGS